MSRQGEPDRIPPVFGKNPKNQMNMEGKRVRAEGLSADSGISILPYGNAWCLLGRGISRVVGELAGLSHSDLCRYQFI